MKFTVATIAIFALASSSVSAAPALARDGVATYYYQDGVA
jgi:hypothetical protein